MLNEPEPQSRPIESVEVSRRGVLGLAAALGLTGSAAFEFMTQAMPAFATAYEYTYPSAARTIFPGDPKGGPFDNHVLHNSSAPGVDYSGNGTGHGSPIVAVKAGTVSLIKSDNSGTYGRQVHIDHGDGSVTKYMHLKATSTTQGSPVNQGDQIGEMGGSADGSDTLYGAHLHICLLIHGIYKDFALYVESSSQTSTSTTYEEEDIIRYIFCQRSVGSYDYGIFGIGVPGGRYTTTDKLEAEVLGKVYGTSTGAPWAQVTPAQFDLAKTLYASLRAAHLAELKA